VLGKKRPRSRVLRGADSGQPDSWTFFGAKMPLIICKIYAQNLAYLSETAVKFDTFSRQIGCAVHTIIGEPIDTAVALWMCVVAIRHSLAQLLTSGLVDTTTVHLLLFVKWCSKVTGVHVTKFHARLETSPLLPAVPAYYVEQCLCNGPVSVCLSVPSIDRCSSVRRVCC